MAKKNEIFLEQKSPLMLISNIAIIGVLIGVVIKSPTPLVIITSAFAIGAIILITFATYYEFRKEYLYVKNGFLSSKIYYSKIKEFGDCQKIFNIDEKWTRRKIYINHGKNFVIGTSYLAPKEPEKFIKILNKKIESYKGEPDHDKEFRKNSVNNKKHK